MWAGGRKFDKFPAVIFVQAPLLFFVLRLLRLLARRIAIRPAAHLLPHGALGSLALCGVGVGAEKIIQIEKHGGTFRGGGDQVAEISEAVWLDAGART